MTFRFAVPIIAAAVAVAGLHLTTTPASACSSAQCTVADSAKVATPEPAKAAAAPLRLDRFKKRPVASRATRVVKSNDGSYKRISSYSRRAKAKKSRHLAKAKPAKIKPAVVEQETDNVVAARVEPKVRLVGAGELNEIDRAAGAAKPAARTPGPAPTFAETFAQAVSTEIAPPAEVAAVVEQTITPDPPPAAVISAPPAQPAPAKDNSWFKNMLLVLGGAFAAASAAARLLIA